MDLYAIARTVQADKDRAIEAESRRRRLLPQADPGIAAEAVRTSAVRRAQSSTSTSSAAR